jgi:hypothetical protein
VIDSAEVQIEQVREIARRNNITSHQVLEYLHRKGLVRVHWEAIALAIAEDDK